MCGCLTGSPASPALLSSPGAGLAVPILAIDPISASLVRAPQQATAVARGGHGEGEGDGQRGCARRGTATLSIQCCGGGRVQRMGKRRQEEWRLAMGRGKICKSAQIDWTKINGRYAMAGDRTPVGWALERHGMGGSRYIHTYSPEGVREGRGRLLQQTQQGTMLDMKASE